jgi:hypothetical protein
MISGSPNLSVTSFCAILLALLFLLLIALLGDFGVIHEGDLLGG